MEVRHMILVGESGGGDDYEQKWIFKSYEKCCECGAKGAWVDREELRNPLGLCQDCFDYEVNAGRLILDMKTDDFDLRKEAKEAIKQYYLSPEGQNEILFALQKGGKWRTLCKRYTKGAMARLIDDEMIHTHSISPYDRSDLRASTDVVLTQKGIEHIVRFCTRMEGESQ